MVADVDANLTSFRVTPGRWGRSGSDASRRSILTALVYLTLHTGKRTVAASIRDLALMPGLGRSTAQRALQALTEPASSSGPPQPTPATPRNSR
jgi:hypothetical protein